jgi:serine/threonine protein phosphatase PrpC
MTGGLVFRTAMISHMGLVRRLNEDSVLAKPEIGLWAVADGMGGHGGGDIASHAVVEALELLAPRPPPPICSANLSGASCASTASCAISRAREEGWSWERPWPRS